MAEDPISPLLASAINVKEFFDSFMEAGFTEKQALALCVGIMSGKSDDDDAGTT